MANEYGSLGARSPTTWKPRSDVLGPNGMNATRRHRRTLSFALARRTIAGRTVRPVEGVAVALGLDAAGERPDAPVQPASRLRETRSAGALLTGT